MAKLYFICGFVGSGKTTYAKELALSVPAFRFSIDEWMMPLYGEHMDRAVFDARLETVQNLFRDASLQMVRLDTSIFTSLLISKVRSRHWMMRKRV